MRALTLVMSIICESGPTKAAEISKVSGVDAAGENARVSSQKGALVAQLAQEKTPKREGATAEAANAWAETCPSGESCRLAQSVVAGASREPILLARAFKSPQPVLVVTAPPRIYLAPGLALQIDSGKSRRYPFETCTNEGCHTGIKIDAALLKEFGEGKAAKVSFFDGTQKVVTVVLSLTGFAKAFEDLR